ncbi:DNA-processing protein DprA, partial [Escherichia coli]|nr:DNA-processing protein DprA [Escherichia coli]
ALRSGSLITADLALDEGRDVFAMPGSVFSETSRGTNHLLQLGAIPLTCVDDVIREFRRRGWQGPETVAEAAAPSLSPAEQAVIDVI